LASTEIIIAIIAIIAAFVTPFLLRSLSKSEKAASNTTNVYNIQTNVSNLEKKVDKGIEDAKKYSDKLCEEHRRDMEKINMAFAAIGADIKLHTSLLVSLQSDNDKFEDRLRKAEDNIIRSERRINGGGYK
jgi:hypothetical protein